MLFVTNKKQQEKRQRHPYQVRFNAVKLRFIGRLGERASQYAENGVRAPSRPPPRLEVFTAYGVKTVL